MEAETSLNDLTRQCMIDVQIELIRRVTPIEAFDIDSARAGAIARRWVS
jgi:hypothetical protein